MDQICRTLNFQDRGSARPQSQMHAASQRSSCSSQVEGQLNSERSPQTLWSGFLGGDTSLVEETAANRLTQESLPEDHPMRLFGETVESEAIKRKREEVQIAELDLQLTEIKGRAKKARITNISESVETGLQSMRNLGLPIDDRARSRASDMIQTALFEEAKDAPDDPEICIRQFLQQKGFHDTSMDSRIGKLAKQLLLKDQPNHVFIKKNYILQRTAARGKYLARVKETIFGASAGFLTGCCCTSSSPNILIISTIATFPDMQVFPKSGHSV